MHDSQLPLGWDNSYMGPTTIIVHIRSMYLDGCTVDNSLFQFCNLKWSNLISNPKLRWMRSTWIRSGPHWGYIGWDLREHKWNLYPYPHKVEMVSSLWSCSNLVFHGTLANSIEWSGWEIRFVTLSWALPTPYTYWLSSMINLAIVSFCEAFLDKKKCHLKF